MKKTILFLMLFSLLRQSYSQQTTTASVSSTSISPTTSVSTTTSTTPTSSVMLSDLEKQLQEIKDIIKANGRDTSSIASDIYLKEKSKIVIYKNDDDTKLLDSLELTDVKVEIREGAIFNLVIRGNFKKEEVKYTNSRAPIDLKTSRFGVTGDVLYTSIRQENATKTDALLTYIHLFDVLGFDEGSGYSPDDDVFTLNSKNKKANLFKSVGINSVLEIRLFSDVLNVFGTKPNGLAQTDVYFKQIVHRSNVGNEGMYFGNNFKVNVLASKFDSKDQYVIIDSTLNRSSILQRSRLSATFAYNIINGWIYKKAPCNYYLDIGVGMSNSQLKDSARIYDGPALSLFGEAGLEVKNFDNWGVTISERFMSEWASYLKQFNEQKFNTTQSVKQTFDDQRFFWRSSIMVYWNPLGNKSNRIFGRLNVYIDNHDQKDLFYQLQFGYSMALSNLVKK